MYMDVHVAIERRCVSSVSRAGYTGYTRVDTQWIHWIHSGYTPLLSYDRLILAQTKPPTPPTNESGARGHARMSACVRGSVENQLAGGLQFPTHTVKLKGISMQSTYKHLKYISTLKP